jgi:hypothetical protein
VPPLPIIHPTRQASAARTKVHEPIPFAQPVASAFTERQSVSAPHTGMAPREDQVWAEIARGEGHAGPVGRAGGPARDLDAARRRTGRGQRGTNVPAVGACGRWSARVRPCSVGARGSARERPRHRPTRTAPAAGSDRGLTTRPCPRRCVGDRRAPLVRGRAAGPTTRTTGRRRADGHP